MSKNQDNSTKNNPKIISQETSTPTLKAANAINAYQHTLPPSESKRRTNLCPTGPTITKYGPFCGTDLYNFINNNQSYSLLQTPTLALLALRNSVYLRVDKFRRNLFRLVLQVVKYLTLTS